MPNSKKIAVLLCGCGFKDGSEIRESVATLWALSQYPVSVQILAPEKNQADVVNTLTGETAPHENRSMLMESARIARGEILPLEKVDSKDFSGLIIPGGFGVAKNLCTFATEGAKGTVLAPVKNFLEQMHQDRKPIGAICIAPALIALTFPQKGFELTVGQSSETASEIEKLGHRHIVCATNGSVTDDSARIVSTPAYMDDQAKLTDIFTGISKLVQEVVRFLTL